MSGVCIAYNDTITLAFTAPDRYNTESIVDSDEVGASIDLNTGSGHEANQDFVDSDAVVFIDHENEFVQDNFYRLEEALIKINLFGTPDADAWYKVIDVNVARDTQLCNEIDNVQLTLKKTTQVS